MAKAIIFDCFGVLTSEGWLPFKAKYFGNNPELYDQATQLIRQANSGLMSQEHFIASVAKLAGITPAEAQNSIRKNVPNEPLLKYIQQLKLKYKIGLLSNVASNFLDQLFTSDQLNLFDEISLSYVTKALKPQARAFELIADRLNVRLNEAVLIDDQYANVTGARSIGMQAVLYQGDVNQFKQELEKLLEKLN